MHFINLIIDEKKMHKYQITPPLNLINEELFIFENLDFQNFKLTYVS